MRMFRRLIAFESLLLAPLLLAYLWFACTTRGRVQYHLGCLDCLQEVPRGPSKFRDYFHVPTLVWWLEGRPPIAQSARMYGEGRKRHEDELVRLGYLETRQFSLTNRILDKQAGDELDAAVHARFSKLRWSYSFSAQSSFVTVTAPREDMPLWGEIMTKLDVKPTL